MLNTIRFATQQHIRLDYADDAAHNLDMTLVEVRFPTSGLPK